MITKEELARLRRDAAKGTATGWELTVLATINELERERDQAVTHKVRREIEATALVARAEKAEAACAAMRAVILNAELDRSFGDPLSPMNIAARAALATDAGTALLARHAEEVDYWQERCNRVEIERDALKAEVAGLLQRSDAELREMDKRQQPLLAKVERLTAALGRCLGSLEGVGHHSFAVEITQGRAALADVAGKVET